MKRRIFKYPLEVVNRQVVYMHKSAVTLSVAEVNSELVLYAMVAHPDPGDAKPRIFQVVTTGDVFEGQGKAFIGRCTLGGWFQAFVFELVSDEWADSPLGAEGDGDTIDHRHDDDFKQIREEQRGSAEIAGLVNGAGLAKGLATGGLTDLFHT